MWNGWAGEDEPSDMTEIGLGGNSRSSGGRKQMKRRWSI